MNRTATRAAFTLTEILVVLGISTLLASGVWNLLIGGNRSFEESTAAGAAARSASLAIERVRRDVANLAVQRTDPPAAPAQAPVRVLSAGEIEIMVTDSGDAKAAAPSVIRMSSVRYKFVPRGLPGEGFYRNGERLSGIALERFEARLARDEYSSGAPFVSLAVIGADPAGRRTFVARDLIYLEPLDKLRRSPNRAPNYLPRLAPDDGESPEA